MMIGHPYRMSDGSWCYACSPPGQHLREEPDLARILAENAAATVLDAGGEYTNIRHDGPNKVVITVGAGGSIELTSDSPIVGKVIRNSGAGTPHKSADRADLPDGRGMGMSSAPTLPTASLPCSHPLRQVTPEGLVRADRVAFGWADPDQTAPEWSLEWARRVLDALAGE